MRAEQTESFFACKSCNCSAADLQRSASRSLVGWSTPPSPHAPPRLASPSRRERGECSAAEGHQRRRLRVRRRPAPPEPTEPRHRGRLIGNRPEEAQLCLHQEQLISQSGLPQCVRLSFTGREEEQLCLQHCPWTTTQPGRGQRLAGGDDKHSQPNAELAKGWQVRMPHARPSTRRRRGWTSSATEWRCSTRTAAMAPRCQPYVPPHTPATVGGATRSDPPPSLDSEFRKS